MDWLKGGGGDASSWMKRNGDDDLMIGDEEVGIHELSFHINFIIQP